MRLLPVLSILFLTILPVSVAAQDAQAGARIVVIGQGTARAAPDQAVITLGARHFAKSAAEALAETSDATAAILAGLKAAGIAETDIQTASISLSPVWGDTRRDKAGRPLPPQGFEASNRVRVTVRALDLLADLLDDIARDGANSFGGFRFGLSDQAPLETEARSAAVLDARTKAAQYAADAGLVLGDVLLMTEERGGGTDAPMPLVLEAAVSRSAPVPVAAGEITVRRSIKVVFSARSE